MSIDEGAEFERADYQLVVALPARIDDLQQRMAAAAHAVEQQLIDDTGPRRARLVEQIDVSQIDEPAGFGLENGRLTATDLAALSASRHALYVSAILGDDARADAEATIALVARIAPELIAVEDVGTWTWRSGRWAREIRDGRELAIDELFDIHAGHADDELQLHTHGLARLIGMEIATIADADDDLDEAERLLAHVALVLAGGGVPEEDEPFAVAEDLAVRWQRLPDEQHEHESADDDEDEHDHEHEHHGHAHATALVTPADGPVPPVGFDAIVVDGWFVPRILDARNGGQARRTLADARAVTADEPGAQLLVFTHATGVVDDGPEIDAATVVDWRLTLPSGFALGPFHAHDLGHLHDLEAGEAGITRVWTGVCEVTEVGDQDLLEGGDGAFVTAIALAASRDEFAATVRAALLESGLLLVEIENLESFATDVAAEIETGSPEYDELLRSVALDGGIELGPFRIWRAEEE